MVPADGAKHVELTDPTFTKPERRSAFDRFWLSMIRDERDLPFVHLSLQVTFVLIPLAVFLFATPDFRWWFAPIYWVVLLGLFLDRCILMLHNTSHRPLFKKKFRFLNNYIPWVLGPFYGETPETYFTHHLGMHHNEGNLEDDLSSTMKYQRDNVLHWLHYFAKFFFAGIFELAVYFYKRGRYDFMWRTLLGEIAWYVVVVSLAVWNFEATFTVFIFPWLFTRMGMMAGNWAQHAFIDPDRPDNDYVSSITCINCRYNRRCFNDGYHISHHLRANRHWTDHPAELMKNREKYVAEGALVFEGVDFFEIWLMLMMKRHRALAERLVDLGEPRSVEEKIELIKSRLRPVPTRGQAPVDAVPTAA